MKHKILILGSTGKLGSKLLKYCNSEKISVNCVTCYKNTKKLNNQVTKYKIPNSYTLSKNEKNFLHYISNSKFKIIYFLDYGSYSLKYLGILLNNNTNSYFAIANKEMLISGGNLLINKINKTKNKIIPIDSEHFSLFKSNPINSDIKKIYITASGGPFYFNKKTNLNKVDLHQVLDHPKWNMGTNNSIDSSNFVNKILELFEVATLFRIDINKIDFLISKEAFIHSIILFKDNTVSFNCFVNNMLITLIKPLTILFNSKQLKINEKKYFNIEKFEILKFDDKRFKAFKFLKLIKKFNHQQIINFILLNNIAHKKYLNNTLNYNDIFIFIMKNINLSENNYKFRSFNDILKYINLTKKNYEKI